MKNVLKIVSVLSLSMLYIPVFSMQPASQTAGKYGIEYAKKLISKSFTAAHWGISTGPFIGQGLGSFGLAVFDKKICDFFSDNDSGIGRYETDLNGNEKPIFRNKTFGCVDASIQEFADEQAKKVGLTKMPSVRVSDFGSEGSAARNVVFITNEYDSILKNALKINDAKEANKAAGILQHEYTHVKNEDMLTHGVECLATPFLTHQLTKKVSKILPFAQKATPFWLQQGIKLSSAMGKYTLNSAILSGLSRRKEQRADDGICDDIATLQAVSDFFVEAEKRHADVPESYLKQKFPKINYYLFASHPSVDDRVTKLNKRIEKLKDETHF